MNDFTPFFLRSSSELFTEWDQICLEMTRQSSPEKLQRLLVVAHSLKGGALMSGLTDVSELIHQAEKLIDGMWKGRLSSTIAAINLLLKTSRTISARLYSAGDSFALRKEFSGLKKNIQDLYQLASKDAPVNQVAAASQESVSKKEEGVEASTGAELLALKKVGATKGHSIHQLFAVLKQVVEEEADWSGMPIGVTIAGTDFSLPEGLTEHLTVPLVHLLRNALVHSFAEVGEQDGDLQIVLRSRDENDILSIEVSDNGKGIDAESVCAHAINCGMFGEETNPQKLLALSREQKLNLIFLPGFSTSDKPNHLAGLGFGMTIVKQKIEQLSGRVTVESERSKGTRFSIEIPGSAA